MRIALTDDQTPQRGGLRKLGRNGLRGCWIVVLGMLAGCAGGSMPGSFGQGSVDVSFEFADGRVETRQFSADQSRVEGCRDVQRLQVLTGDRGQERIWVDVLFSEEISEVSRLSYVGPLTGGAYASWASVSVNEGQSLTSQYREQPLPRTALIDRPRSQSVDLAVAVEAPWASAPEITRVDVNVNAQYRAQWWLTDLRVATVYCDQVTGAPRL